MTSRPSVRAAAWTSRISSTTVGFPTLAKIANRPRPGTTSRNSSIRLPTVSICWSDRPVTLPPGRARLEPISKSPEEDNEASELYEAEEVVGVVFPTDEDAALPLNPSKEALHEPTSHIAA